MERVGLRPRFAAYVIVAFWTSAVIVFGVVEHLVDPETFDTVWLGMWWALQTVTTVGYGDVVPHDTAGRLIASFLLLGGLSLLAVVTGVITSGFVMRAQALRHSGTEQELMRALGEVTAKLEQVSAALDRSQRRPGAGSP